MACFDDASMLWPEVLGERGKAVERFSLLVWLEPLTLVAIRSGASGLVWHEVKRLHQGTGIVSDFGVRVWHRDVQAIRFGRNVLWRQERGVPLWRGDVEGEDAPHLSNCVPVYWEVDDLQHALARFHVERRSFG